MREQDIQKWARYIAFLEGKEIYKNKRVMRCTVGTEQGHKMISADVKGSGRNIYFTEVELNENADAICGYYCDCPAFDQYLSLCKHGVAALFEYMEMEKDGARTRGAVPEGGEDAPLYTTPAIRSMLEKRVQVKALPVVGRSYFGKVRIKPHLTTGYHTHLEFKLGVARMYVMKNLLDFENRMDTKQEYSYGKQLSFIHVREAFEEQSRALADFICRWAKKYVGRNSRRYLDSVYYYGPNAIREMELDSEDLEDFLLAVGNVPFPITDRDGRTRDWQRQEGGLPRKLKITGRGNGFVVECPKENVLHGPRFDITFEDGNIYMEDAEKFAPVKDFMECMNGQKNHRICVDKEDAPVFCRELLPALESVYDVEKESFDVQDFGLVPARYEFFLDEPGHGIVTCRAEAVYGEKRYSVFDEEVSPVRDLQGEAVVRELVSHYGNAFDQNGRCMALAHDDNLLYELLTSGIKAMKGIGKVFVSDAIKKYDIRESPHVTMGVSLSGDMLHISMESAEMTRAELVEILSKYQKKKKYYRLKNGSFVKMEKDGLAVLKEISEELNLTAAQLREKEIQVPAYRALYLETRGREKRGNLFSFERDRGFRELIRRVQEAPEQEYAVPESLDTILRPYQKEGFSWLKTLCSFGFGGILADDMGLGKTLQVISFLLSEFREAGEDKNCRTIVVAPASLVFNWQSEIERFAPELSVGMVTGNAAERREMILQSGPRDVLLTSYDLVRRDAENYKGIPFFCEVIDEAQYIKNHNTKAAHAVKRIRADFKIALTGTPVENRLSELWSIFDYLMPGFLYAYKRFREEIELPVVQNGEEAEMERLQKMISPFVLRRLKREVLKELPDKIEENIYAPLVGEQKKLYSAHVQRIRILLDKQSDEEFKKSKIEILSELTRLRQLCCSPGLVYENYGGNAEKLETCLDLVEHAVEGGHKILLFSQFTSMLQILQEHLDERGITFFTLTGNTGKEKRLQLVEQFNQDDTSVFCISLKAGGTGLNLTAADVVIHYDPWWNLAVQNQATDRAHRIGQHQVVTVYRLVMRDTIEENIIRLQEKKRELADQVLGGEGIGSANLSREELLEVLGG